MSEKPSETGNRPSSSSIHTKLAQIGVGVCKLMILIFNPRYHFPIEKILSEIPKNKSITIRISIKNNTLLIDILESILLYIGENIKFEIHLRDWIEKDLREKIEILRRGGKQISFIGGIKNDPEYGYTSIGQAMENMPLLMGEVYDSYTGDTLLYFQDTRIEGEKFFTLKKPSV